MPFSKAHDIIVPLDRTESRQNRLIIDTVTVKGSDRYRSSAVYARVTGDVLIASHATDAKRDETENHTRSFMWPTKCSVKSFRIRFPRKKSDGALHTYKSPCRVGLKKIQT